LNWSTFLALLARDAHVARRKLAFMLVQNLFQPLLLAFVFGRILTADGMEANEYKNVLLPGTVCVCMLMSGVWGVAMPLIAEFQLTREIDDRLLAPIAIEWIAVEKVLAGMIQALVAGLVVLPCAWLVMGPGVGLGIDRPWQFAAVCILVALLSGAAGLALGCSVGQAQTGLIFSVAVAPLVTFGCAYYPWSWLRIFPVLQYAVLLNPLVYANEGLRGAMSPQMPHIHLSIVIGALTLIDAGLLAVGLKAFHGKAVG
jgi:ABC-2 type transport system permease protein